MHQVETIDIKAELTALTEALKRVEQNGGGKVRWWVNRPTPEHDMAAQEHGLHQERDLLQLRRSLPLTEDLPSTPLEVRAFRPGYDEDTWLEVNNRAFSQHLDQGNWDRSILESRMNEPWFDPEGFLIYEQDGHIAGFCWTKVHADDDPATGEIYVIGLDPNYQGKGLGRSILIAGLEWLAKKGITTCMLYVDLANDSALHLYKSMGFTVDHLERSYVGDIAPSDSLNSNQ